MGGLKAKLPEVSLGASTPPASLLQAVVQLLVDEPFTKTPSLGLNLWLKAVASVQLLAYCPLGLWEALKLGRTGGWHS